VQGTGLRVKAPLSGRCGYRGARAPLAPPDMNDADASFSRCDRGKHREFAVAPVGSMAFEIFDRVNREYLSRAGWWCG